MQGKFVTLTAAVCILNGLTSEYVDDRNSSCTEWQCSMDERSRRKATCNCDDRCNLFGDCCEEFSNMTKQYIRGRAWDHVQCIHHCLVSTASFFFAVTTCPEGSNQDLQDLCHNSNSSDLLAKVPATGKSSGLLYKNIFCAKCHEEEADHWQLYVFCYDRKEFNQSINYSFKELLKKGNCRPGVKQPHHVGNIRRCHPEVVSVCPQNSDLKEECENGFRKFVFNKNGTYRNAACAVCNAETSFECNRRITPPCRVNIILASMYSLTLLFDFKTGNSVQTLSTKSQPVREETKVNVNCSSSEIYDPFLNSCRRVSCAQGLKFEGKCQTPRFLESVSSRSKLLSCPTVVLNESEFTILHDGRLMHLASLSTHDKHDFSLNGSRAIVCTSVLNSGIYPTKASLSSVEGIVSGTGMILSEIGLFLTLLVYTLLKPLRNIPGCNLMCLSASLFLANLCMLVAPTAENVPDICRVLSIGTHYFFLAAFMWMNIMSFDLWSTFARTINMVKSDHRFILYSLCSWLMTAVPVIPAVIMDTYLPQSVYSPKYGHGICWISNPLALAIFFAGPLAIIILINSILFILTSITICRVKSSTARRLGREDKSQFLIYIKLFLVMGLTWTFGFISAFVPHPVLTYLFIVLNSLQGLLIALSFLCTRRVFRLLEKFWSQPPPDSTTTSIRLSTVSTTM